MKSFYRPIPLVFWRGSDGSEPVRHWLWDLLEEDRKIIGRDISRVQYGWPIGLPLCRPLGDGLWEIRSTLKSKREARVLICFERQTLVALSAFIKKTRTAPLRELELAKSRMRDLEK